ncbi:MAG: AAA family ATPase [Clostridiales bacterium]|nr:AAA family ATPase [Clostridiales bacterium]
MALSSEQWTTEKNRLKKLYNLITVNIEVLEAKLKNSLSEIKNSNKEMWKAGKSHHYDFDDVVENLSLLDGVQADIMRHDNIMLQLKKMFLLQKCAYFGRIDFQENDYDDIDVIYIGTSTLEGEGTELLIYDWRAAVSSMFYECEIGEAGFISPSGRIDGEILLKRQYKIYRDEIESMFNSSIIIEDEILQNILSESKNSRMGTIVSSIQKEQNKAIRDENHKIVFVDGPAGSGKTSIALHRAAWLMYRYRDKMKARNIMVYSPNDIFNDYISDVLPELGEENMQMSTFMSLALAYLGRKYRFMDKYTQMEGILNNSSKIDKDSIKEKSSAEYAGELFEFVNYLKDSGFDFSAIETNGNTLAAEWELKTLFYRDYKMHNISTRLEKIYTLLEKRLINVTRKIRKNYVETAKNDHNEGKKAAYFAKSTVEELRRSSYRLTHPDPFEVYYKFLIHTDRKRIALEFRKNLDANTVHYEDIAPVMLLKLFLGYSREFKEIKHLIIDEVQDYSHIEMMVFSRLFKKVPMTLLGDANQAINHLTDSNDLKSSVMGESYTVKLEKSYRSTRQITKFCYALLGRGIGYEYVDRNGEEPKVKKSSGNIQVDVKLQIDKFKKNGNTSIAVITKTAVSAEKLYEEISDQGIGILRKSDISFSTGTVVLPSYLAKGLEFDAVIVIDTNTEHFSGDKNRKLFYTCCSRALHDLCIIYENIAPYHIDKL